MKLTEEQWRFVSPLLPKEKVRTDRRGRPWKDPRAVLEGILWVLKTGARWKDLPERYPPYQTCHRRFQSFVKQGVMKTILEALVTHLRDKGHIDLTETFIDATFVKAKKGGLVWEKPSEVKAPKSWPLQTIQVFLSPYPLQVLHRMRVSSLTKRFGSDIQKTFLCDLSETKRTIVTHLMPGFLESMDSCSLLPTSQIENERKLKMDALYAVTSEGGPWSDSLLGFSIFDE